MRRALTTMFLASVLLRAPAALAQTAAAAQPESPPVTSRTPPVALADAVAATRAMSLGEALAYAKAHQPAVLAAIARVGAQAEAANVPRAQWQPLIGVTAQLLGATANNTTASYVTTGDVAIPRIGATRAVSSGTWRPYASSLAGAGITQEAFDFGRIAAQATAADTLVDVERQSARTAVLDVTYGVVESYFATYAAKAVLKSAEDAFTRARVHRDLAKSGVGSGMRSPIELTRAEADLARYDAGRIRAQGGVQTAQAVFAAAVGVNDAALDVVGTAPPSALDLPALNEAIARASARDPRVLGAIAQLRAQEDQTRAIRAEARPNLSLTGTISGRGGGAPGSSGPAADEGGWVPNVPNWDVGAILSWPLFDPVVTARADASRAAEDVRREALNQARFEEVAAIRQAYVAVVVARDALPALQQSLDAARANWAQADARFRAGLGTAVELADAEAVLADAEISLALGVFDVARSRASLGRTIAEGL